MAEDKYAGLTIDYIERPKAQSHPDFAFRIGWSCPRIGFGEATFFWKDDKLHAMTECMSNAFMKRLMSTLVDHIVIDE